MLCQESRRCRHKIQPIIFRSQGDIQASSFLALDTLLGVIECESYLTQFSRLRSRSLTELTRHFNPPTKNGTTQRIKKELSTCQSLCLDQVSFSRVVSNEADGTYQTCHSTNKERTCTTRPQNEERAIILSILTMSGLGEKRR